MLIHVVIYDSTQGSPLSSQSVHISKILQCLFMDALYIHVHASMSSASHQTFPKAEQVDGRTTNGHAMLLWAKPNDAVGK